MNASFPARFRRGTAIALALAVAGCTGSGAGNVVPQRPDAAGAATARRSVARLTMRVKIPHRRRRPAYISSGTESIVVHESGKLLGTFNSTPSSQGCSLVGSTTQCRFTMGAIPGVARTIAVSAFSGLGGGGSVLSTGSVAQTIVAGKANTIAITLGGVPAALALTLSNPSPTEGTSASIALTVTAQDASGATIVAPGNYAHAITLSDSDTSGATSLSSNTVTSPTANTVTVAYDGASNTSATFTASAPGVTNATAVLKSVKPHSSFVGGVWAAIPNLGSVAYYDNAASPNFGLSGGGLTSASAVAVDSTGRVLAGDANGNIELWPLNATGAVTPTVSITGAGDVTALAWDPVNGRIIFAAANTSSFGVVTANASGVAGAITRYYSAPAYPLASTISGLAVDPNAGTLYVANATPTSISGSGSGGCNNFACINILVFTLQADGSYQYDHDLDLEDNLSSNWYNVGQIAFDPSVTNSDGSLGALWVANETPGYDIVQGFASSSRGGTLLSVGTLTGDGADLIAPATVAWDGGSGLWIGDQSSTWLQHWTSIYSSPSVPTGNSFYLGAADGNASPTGIAVFSVYTPSLRRRPALRGHR